MLPQPEDRDYGFGISILEDHIPCAIDVAVKQLTHRDKKRRDFSARLLDLFVAHFYVVVVVSYSHNRVPLT